LCKDNKKSDPGIERGQCISEEVAAAVHPKPNYEARELLRAENICAQHDIQTGDDPTIICEYVYAQENTEALTMGALLNAGRCGFSSFCQ